MREVENFELVFSHDPDNGDEILLLTIERTDIDTELGAVDRVEKTEDTGTPALRMSFNEGQTYVLLPGVPDTTYEQLDNFDSIWVCWMDEGDIVDDAQVPLAA